MVADETGVCRIVWFNGGYLRNQVQLGQVIVASGKPNVYKHQLQLTNPKFMMVEEPQPGDTHADPDRHFSGGVYPASGRLSSRQIKQIILPVLDHLDELVDEFYDDELPQGVPADRPQGRVCLDSHAAGREEARRGQAPAQV